MVFRKEDFDEPCRGEEGGGDPLSTHPHAPHHSPSPPLPGVLSPLTIAGALLQCAAATMSLHWTWGPMRGWS